MFLEEVVTAVSEKTGFSKKDSKAFIRAFEETVINELENGGSVKLVGFGTFSVADVKERNCINPTTLKKMVTPPHKAPRFKFAKNVKSDIR